MALGIGSLGNGLCACSCHRSVPDGMKKRHVTPCCSTCPRCGARVKINAELMHLLDCPTQSPELPASEIEETLGIPPHPIPVPSSLKSKDKAWLNKLSRKLLSGVTRHRLGTEPVTVPPSERVCTTSELKKLKELIRNCNLACQISSYGYKNGAALHLYEHGSKNSEDYKHVFTMNHRHLLAPQKERPVKALKIFTALVENERNLQYLSFYNLRIPSNRARPKR